MQQLECIPISQRLKNTIIWPIYPESEANVADGILQGDEQAIIFFLTPQIKEIILEKAKVWNERYNTCIEEDYDCYISTNQLIGLCEDLESEVFSDELAAKFFDRLKLLLQNAIKRNIGIVIVLRLNPWRLLPPFLCLPHV